MSEWCPPTDEQLERFIFAVLNTEAWKRGITDVNAAWGARMVMRNPTLKAAWIERHRALREAVSGEDAQ